LIEKLTFEDFAAHLHEPFHVYYTESEYLEMMLKQVSHLGDEPAADEDRTQAFSIIFQCPEKDKYLIQAIYKIKHEKMGDLDIFLVPLGPNKEGTQYEAIFN